MKITGKSVKANKSPREVYELCSSARKIKDFLPSMLKSFESGKDDELRFSIMGISQLSLRVTNSIPYKRVVMQSSSEHPLTLTMNINGCGENESEINVDFEGDLNIMPKSMGFMSFIFPKQLSIIAEKPIEMLIDRLTDKIGEQFQA